MILEIALLIAIYSIWVLSLVNSMVSAEEVSLTIDTLPFIVTLPIALFLAAFLEPLLPGIFAADIILTAIIGVLLFVRWVMAIAGE